MFGTRNRTLILYVILIVAFFVVLGFLFNQIAKHYMVESFEQQLSHDTHFISDQLEEQAQSGTLTEEDLEYYANYFQLDLYYSIDDREVSTLGNQNEELLQTVQNLSRSEEYTLHNERLIYPYEFTTEETLIAVSDPLPIEQLQWTIWWIVGLLALLIIAFLWSFGNRMYDSYVQPIRNATDTAERLVEGDYHARVMDAPYGIASELGQSINRLARNLKYITGKYENQNSRLKTVVNNMVSGILLVNEKGITRLINDSFINYFSIKETPIVDRVYYDVIDHEEVNDLIQEAIFNEEKRHATIKKDGLYLDVHVAPIKNADGTWKGIVIVAHDITEIKQVENVRKDFVANVSHELRTPLTSMQGFAETLLYQDVDEKKEKEFLKIIEKESKRLNSLVEDLLDLALIEKDSFELQKTEFRLKMLMDEVYQVVEDQLNAKKITAIMNVPPELMVYADYYRWYQLVMNLFTNAVQYTDEYGEIEWNVTESDEEIVMQIKDTGIGIPEEELHRIFERFYRVDQARSRLSGGTGLGLSIVKHIVEVHDGSIDIDSTPDEGTTITVRLPTKDE